MNHSDAVINGAIQVEMRKVKARADAVSANSRTGVEKYLRGTTGCTVFEGAWRGARTGSKVPMKSQF